MFSASSDPRVRACRVLLAAALCCGSIPALASSTVRECRPVPGAEPRPVSGAVHDREGAPVAGATVEISCGSVVHAATTSADGRFELSVAPGHYLVRIEAASFAPLADDVEIAAAGTPALAFRMIPADELREEVTVTALRSPLPGRARGATKTATPLSETPQSITVVPRQRIEDIGAQGVQDALGYAAGVRSDAFGLDSRTDSVLIRGSYPDEYLDGMRQLFNYYTSTTRVDPYQLERIEVLRGPASILYGQGTTAGIVNLVTKAPQATEHREVAVRTGSFGRLQAQADFTGPLDEDGRWLYRVVALAREADTQVDHVPDDRTLFAPSITWRPNDATSFTVQLQTQRDRTGSTLQFFPWSGSVRSNPNGEIPTDRFIGEPGFDHYDSDRDTLSWTLDRRLGETWTLRHAARLVRNEVDYRSLYADAFSSPGDSFIDPEQRRIGRYAWLSNPKVRMWTADQNAQTELRVGATTHRLLFGVDALGFEQRSRSAFGFPEHLGGDVPSIDVYDPVYTGYTPPPYAAEPETTQSQIGLYVQDQMKLGERFVLLSGLRHDRTRSGQEGAATERENATTGRLGLLFRGARGLSPYVSYSQSFSPIAGTNFHGDRFDPLRGEQIEVGLRVEPRSSALAFHAAAFDLREENRLVADPDDPLNQVQTGATDTNGLELELVGRVARGLELSAHYNYLDNDDQLDGVPAHQAAVWATRRLPVGRLAGLVGGVGVRWFDAFRDATAPRVPSVTLVDAMLTWEQAPWRLALHANNLTDERYVSTCLPRGDCFFGSRLTIGVSAGYLF